MHISKHYFLYLLISSTALSPLLASGFYEDEYSYDCKDDCKDDRYEEQESDEKEEAFKDRIDAKILEEHIIPLTLKVFNKKALNLDIEEIEKNKKAIEDIGSTINLSNHVQEAHIENCKKKMLYAYSFLVELCTFTYDLGLVDKNDLKQKMEKSISYLEDEQQEVRDDNIRDLIDPFVKNHFIQNHSFLLQKLSGDSLTQDFKQTMKTSTSLEASIISLLLAPYADTDVSDINMEDIQPILGSKLKPLEKSKYKNFIKDNLIKLGLVGAALVIISIGRIVYAVKYKKRPLKKRLPKKSIQKRVKVAKS